MSNHSHGRCHTSLLCHGGKLMSLHACAAAACLGLLPSAWGRELEGASVFSSSQTPQQPADLGSGEEMCNTSPRPLPCSFPHGYYLSLSCHLVPVLPNDEGRCTGFTELYPIFFHVPDVLLGLLVRTSHMNLTSWKLWGFPTLKASA